MAKKIIKRNQRQRTAYYARTATSDGNIESQIIEIRNAIKRDGNKLQAKCGFQDAGWSGIIMHRPGLNAMRKAAQAHKFDILYIWDRARLSRKSYHQEILIHELVSAGIKFKSLQDITADNPAGLILQNLQGIFHKYENLKRGALIKRGLRHKQLQRERLERLQIKNHQNNQVI